jgi:hypothetical protein
MADIITTKYKEFTINYDELDNLWVGYLGKDGDKVNSSASLSGLKKLLDKYGQAEKKFKRVEIISSSGWRRKANLNGFATGVITSITDDSYLWITWHEKVREKVYSGDKVWLDTPENRDKTKEYADLEDRIEELREAQKQILNSMEHFKPSEG